MLRSHVAPKHSVLILGSTQTGKTALIEHVRNYADQEYVKDKSLLGNGLVSKTDTTTPILIHSNLPTYEAYRKDTGEVIDLKNLAAQYEDEEDFRDVLHSKPDAVGMRQVHQDQTAPSEPMEFRFLDTPGLNGTQGRDSEHATSIVNEIISTRSFNLIIIVISVKVPWTEERQLALEYFAYILRGLHARIVFLYTHVDYFETHYSNMTHHLDISLRNKTVSRIFRRHDGESMFDEFNITEYPSLNIDLSLRNRPVVECLIRSTIREILVMATAPPAVLDTSNSNIERIRAVTYPSEFFLEQRKNFEASLRSSIFEGRRRAKSNFSVLIVGRTQSGKSTLIEHIKNYADPTYAIDRSLLGNGNLSKTESTRPFYVETSLPAYEAYRKDTGEVIDLKNLAAQYPEEDYRHILFARERDVGMRMAPQDPNEPSEVIEFRFLDTPGLNDTNERDISHAVNIISEMINTRSFNLIVIIVSYKNPLTHNQQLSLEYYANVFKGLHTRIMFLHTHVDYADVHHTNQAHHLNMKMKNKALSKMFRRFDSEGVPDEENVKEYSSLAIDLVSKKRPVINCLIRNTIREILKMATEPAVILDTSIQNIDRIRAITHPSKFNHEERKKIKARFAAEAASLPKPTEEEQDIVGGEDLEQINILLIGDFQSGKTSLVEIFKLYADPNYQAKTEHITQDNSRFAYEKVKITAFLADLHIVQIRKLKASGGGYYVVDLEEDANRLSEGNFEDLLNLGPKNAETVLIAPNNAKKYRFNIYEGPSLNESAESFEKNIFSIHKTLVESKAEFHQVLFTLAPDTIISAIRTTIRVCLDIFSDLASLFSFVHTKIDYSKLHSGNKQFQESMKERTDLLQKYIQGSAAPYMIDCNLQSNLPVQRAKTYNVVHEILKSATSQTPRALKSPLMKKTPKMVSIDDELEYRAQIELWRIKNEIARNIKDLLELQGKIRQLDLDYKAKDQEVNSANNKEDIATRDDMEVVFEDTFTAAAEPYPEIFSKTMTFKTQTRTIEKVHMVYENVDIEQALGGEGFNHWKIIYRRTSGAATSLVVKLYTKKLDGTGNPVGETEELAKIRRERLELEKQLTAVEESICSEWQVKKEYDLLRDWISRATLPRAVMEELTKAEVYEARETPFDKIKEIYLKSGGVYDTDPCEPLEMLADAPLKSGGVYDTNPCDPVEMLAVALKDFEVDEDDGILWDCILQCTMEVYEPSNTKTGSVLMLGKTQAGKSTFIEYVKNYASQRCDIDESLLGTGSWSKTREPVQFLVTSNLPVYVVYDSNGTRIDIDTLSDKHQDPDDYSDALDDRKTTLKPVPHNPETSLPFVEITFLDTPGIEDTYGKDVEHAPKIIEAMAKMQKLNLIIVIINCEEAPSMTHQLAFNYYSKVIQTFQGHHSNIVFLYTHVDYQKCHHSNTDHLKVMELRHKAFSQLFRCQGSYNLKDVSTATVESYPMYNIDLAKRQRPVKRCMRLMTLRKILAQVVDSPPVVLNTSISNMQRIQAIAHPDELNQAERQKILNTTRAILEQEQGPQDCNDTPAIISGECNSHEDSARNACEDGRVRGQPAPDHDDKDCEEYFQGLAITECSDNDDEDDNLSGPNVKKTK